ncbi:uncharacterized protein LOC135937269 [Cloeon dipterum]|uniref:uncharacterized protein LOC135937269 n=1 Tax=Cloeon dipterum TaxID=197152 RepID=UPI00321F9083
MKSIINKIAVAFVSPVTIVISGAKIDKNYKQFYQERMESAGKLQLVLLSICLQIFSSSCVSITFQNNTINSWDLLLGANEKELEYDFCRRDASNNKERCHNHPDEPIDIKRICNCTLNHTVNAEGDMVYFALNCNNATIDDLYGACPQKLTVTYEHGDVRHPDASAEIPPTADQIMADKSCSSLFWILLFSLSLVINVVFGVVIFMLKNQMSSLQFSQQLLSRNLKQTDNYND